MGTIGYFIKEAIRGCLQAKIMTSVSIATVAVTLFFLGLILVGLQNMYRWNVAAQAEASVSVFLTDAYGGDPLKIAEVEKKVRGFKQVAGVVVVDKEAAMRRFEKLYGSEMLESVSDNPLPASLEITLASGARTPAAMEAFGGQVEKLAGVETIRFAREWIDTLSRIGKWFAWGTSILAIVLLLALYFMIANTIKLTIYARRDLVTNMRFVGATDTYINTPFIFEGMLQGMLGSLLGIAGLFMVRVALGRFNLDWGPGYLLYQIIFFTGVIFGCIGSWRAVLKSLD
jgi:cell division transport system permease protein